MIIKAFIIFIFVYFPNGVIFDEIKEESGVEDINGDMDITEFVVQQGYPIETHEVQTEDGYILTIFRIPRGQNNLKGVPNDHPVLINHALGVSSEMYVLLGAKRSWAFVLADNGYDVWMMNGRGAWHSKRHKNMDASQRKFWNFSWHEIGTYDIPAVINYVLTMTSKKNLQYVGHSQGTTTFFVMAAERPEFNSKIKVMIALAPGARYKYMSNPFLKMLSPFYKLLEALANYLDLHEIPPSFLSGHTLRKLLKTMCFQSGNLSLICKLVAEYIAPFMDLIDMPQILTGIPSSFCVRQALHYAQLIAIGNFQQYDWGPKKNLKKYGSEVPPLYNLKNISCPVGMFWSAQDMFAAVEDVQFLREQLPNIVEDYKIPVEGFSHCDFIVGNNLDELLYIPVLELMNKYK